MNPEEARAYHEAWEECRDYASRLTDRELVASWRLVKEQAGEEQPANFYFWGGHDCLEMFMVQRGLPLTGE